MNSPDNDSYNIYILSLIEVKLRTEINILKLAANGINITS